MYTACTCWSVFAPSLCWVGELTDVYVQFGGRGRLGVVVRYVFPYLLMDRFIFRTVVVIYRYSFVRTSALYGYLLRCSRGRRPSHIYLPPSLPSSKVLGFFSPFYLFTYTVPEHKMLSASHAIAHFVAST